MALFTSASLKQRSAKQTFSERSFLLAESNKAHVQFDIFLSHSFLDRDEVEGIYLELTDAGYSVYVDWIIDPHLDRNNVTKNTAEIIRGRMKASKSLVLAISEHATVSRWMPWELGFVDAKTNRCAILPVSKNAIAPKTYTRSEYLLLYPYIKRAAIDYLEKMYITESGNTYVAFNDWLKKNETPIYNYTNIDLL
jgi:hypothetical protein